MEKLLFVAVGGACGAVLRFVTVSSVGRWMGDLAFGTIVVNVVGSFAMGVLAVVLLERWAEGGARYAPLLLTGVLGGFTTFSAFSLDALRLYESGKAAAALAYIGASVSLALIGLVLGVVAARALSA